MLFAYIYPIIVCLRDDNYIFIVYNKSSIQQQEYRVPVGMWNENDTYPINFV